jgi:hypothetical protein
VPLNGCSLLGDSEASEPAEEEVIVVLVGDEVLLILGDVEPALHSLLVGLGGEVFLEVSEGGQKLVLGDDAFDFPVFYELKVGVLLHQALQFRLLGFSFCLWLLLLGLRFGFRGIVVFAH